MRNDHASRDLPEKHRGPDHQLCELQNGLSDFDMEAEVGLDVHKPIKGYAGS